MINRLVTYIKETRKEMSRVNWPTRRQTAVSTAIVIAFSLVVAAFLGLLDMFFQFILRIIAL